MDAVKKIYAEEGNKPILLLTNIMTYLYIFIYMYIHIYYIGIFAFFKGLESCLWRHAIWSGGYFGVIHGVRASLPEAHVNTITNQLLYLLILINFSYVLLLRPRKVYYSVTLWQVRLVVP
jgi:hypothetical protein